MLGLDVLDSPFTTVVGSVTDRAVVRRCLIDVDTVIHTATLHMPHLASHDRQAFIDTNVTGTLALLEEATAAHVGRFIFTSTTSTFGHALRPPPGAPATWITEDIVPVPRNVYGVTKTAAEDLCQLVHRHDGLAVVILRVARFFPEPDDDAEVRAAYDAANVRANEFLYRRVDIADAVDAHLLAVDRAPDIGFAVYIISATTPFSPHHTVELVNDAPALVRQMFPDQPDLYARRGWRMFPRIDRVYVNTRARTELGWTPRYDYRRVLDSLAADEDPRSPLARTVGSKGYHR